jgi:S-adenosylmethionine synthetase
VEAKLAGRCEVQLAYAIGVAEPVSIMVETFGTGELPDEHLERVVRRVFDLTPHGIITSLKLKRPIYSPTAAYGHFGRKPVKGKVNGKPQEFFTWEQPSRVRALLSEAR